MKNGGIFLLKSNEPIAHVNEDGDRHQRRAYGRVEKEGREGEKGI